MENKLISRNPILRFKLGKSKDPSNPLKLTYNNGAWSNLLGNMFSNWNWSTGILGNFNLSNLLNVLKDNINDLSNLSSVQNATSRDYSFMTKGTRTRSPEELAKWEAEVLRLAKIQTKYKPTPIVKGTTPTNNNSMFLSKMGGWNKSMGDKILDTESLNMLKELGWTGNAREILRLLNQNNIGGYEVKEDNRWGNLSKSALKAYYDKWKSLNPLTEQISPLKLVVPEYKELLNLEAISQNPTVQTELNIINNNNLSFERNANLNKSLTRDLMRLMGLNPYDFSGALRKALRLYKNGLSDDVSLLRGTPLYDLFVTPYLYKTGGRLISRNPIKRFKSNFRKVVQ